ncbi:MAG: acetate kinase, partial [Anaerolineae bacterium]|nr:acetate kinase [Anaerolineae bacterium]
SAYVRRHALAGLDNLGIVLDTEKNDAGATGPVTEIQALDGRVKIVIIPTNEELEIATQTMAKIEAV